MSYTAPWKDVAGIQADTAETIIKALDSDLALELGDTFKSAKLLLALAKTVTGAPKSWAAELHVTLREAMLTSIAGALPKRDETRNLTAAQIKAITTTLKAGESSVARDRLEPVLLDTFSLHDHPYVLELSRLAATVLAQAGFEERDIDRAIERARWEVNSEFARLVIEGADRRSHLVEHLKLRDTLGSQFEADLLRYRAELSRLGREPIFDEPFGIDRLYVDLRISEYRHQAPENDRWQPCAETLVPVVISSLEDLGRVTFIEGGPGTGKSSFCKMLASRIARDHTSPYYPIFIRLRDPAVKPSVDNFQEMFEKALADKGFNVDTEFLRKKRFLFILDGFDELVISGGARVNLRNFFHALREFQRKCDGGGAWHHKVLVTGRPMAIENPVQDIPESFQRFRIEPLDREQLLEWLGNWGRVRGEVAEARLKLALEQGGCLEDPKSRKRKNPNGGLQIIARQTLLLYLIGKLDEDGKLTPELIQSEHPTTLYKSAVDWICGRTGDRQDWRRLNNDEQRSLRRGLQAAGLAIFHSGREHVGMERVRAALKGETKVLTFLEHGGTALLASFYFKESAGGVEFSHKSFGEYLAAEAILETLKKVGQTSEGDYLLDLEDAAHRCYATLGPRALTKEVAQTLRELLLESFPDSRSEVRQALTTRLIELDDQLLDEVWLNRGVVQRARQDSPEVGIRALDINTHAGLLQCAGWLIAVGAEDSQREPEWFQKALRYGEGALLEGATFARRQLAGTRIRSTIIHSDMSGANLSEALLGAVIFEECSLNAASFESTIFRQGATSAAYRVGHGLVHPGAGGFSKTQLHRTDFSNAQLTWTQFGECSMTECEFLNASLSCCSFDSVDIVHASMKSITIDHTRFGYVHFTGCDFDSARMENVELLGCTFDGTRLKNTEFRKVNLTDSDLKGALLEGSRWGTFTCPRGLTSGTACDCELHTYIATHPEAVLPAKDPHQVVEEPAENA